MGEQLQTTIYLGCFVDPENLICPGCGETVRCAPPAYWRVQDGLPVPQFSHQDRTVLCGKADPDEREDDVPLNPPRVAPDDQCRSVPGRLCRS